jgi:L-iditol 2-dehydrogenase
MSGQQYHCADWRSIGVFRPGGFAEYTIAAENLCHVLPDSVSFDAAALLDVYACATHALARVPVSVGDRVVIIGSGAVGIALAEMSNLAGAGSVAMLGRRAAALDFAAKVAQLFPIDVTAGDPVEAVMEWTGGRGADIVYEAVGGHQQTLGWAVQMAARGGRVGIEGAYTELQTIDARYALRTELSMYWIQSYDRRRERSEYDITRDLVAAGKLNPDAIVTHHFTLDQIVEAFEAADNRAVSGAVRVMVHP